MSRLNSFIVAATIAGCATPQLPGAEKPRPESNQPTPSPIDPLCEKTIGKLWVTLDPESPTRCTENNSTEGPRSYELRGACSGAMSDPKVEKIADELHRAARACFFLEIAASARAQAEQRQEAQRKRAEARPAEAQKEPEVTKVCEETLNVLDTAFFVESTKCAEDNSKKGPRFARLKLDCERRLAIDSRLSWQEVPKRVFDIVDRLERTDAYCRQTDPSYRKRMMQR